MASVLPALFPTNPKLLSSKTLTINPSFTAKSHHLPPLSTLLRNSESIASQSAPNEPFNPEIYGEMLQHCVNSRALSTGRQIHAQILKRGELYSDNDYLNTKLLILYAKCGCLEDSEKLFFRQGVRNVFSWAAMIGLYSSFDFIEKAVAGFCEMLEAGVFPDNFVIPNALKACSALQLIGCGMGVHGYSIKLGFASCVYVLSSLVDFYGKCGDLLDARKVFDKMPFRNVITWNTMIVGYVHNGLYQEALELFCEMRAAGIEPTRVSISSFLSASANISAFDEGRQIHAVVVVNGLELDNILGSSLINFYCKVGLVEEAEFIFSRMVNKDTVTWNLLISGFVQDGQVDKAMSICHEMIKERFKFDSVTLSSIISAAASSFDLKLGQAAHGYCIKNSFGKDTVVASSIVDMYAKTGRIDCAKVVFDLSSERDLMMWNTMTSAYAHHEMSGEALKLFYLMQLESITPDVVSWNSVILAFLRDGKVNDAMNTFSEMLTTGASPNNVTWTTLIFGLAENGCGHEAIKFFVQMQEMGFKPSVTVILGVLLACINLVSQRYGKAIHGLIIRGWLLSSTYATTSLIDMYAKCGSIKHAIRVFHTAPEKTLPLYNALILGYALHGQAKEALEVYKNMHELMIVPDEISFTGLLSACSHAGFLLEGLEIFTDMVSKYHVAPTKEHYGCLATLFARKGSIEEARRLLSAMPVKPDGHIISSLLSFCRENHEMEVGESLMLHLFDLEPDNLANIYTLANRYAASEQWRMALEVRQLAKQNGFRKYPGYSSIQIGNEINAFVASDRAHPHIENIRNTLLCLDRVMKYVPCAYSTSQTYTLQEDLCV